MRLMLLIFTIICLMPASPAELAEAQRALAKCRSERRSWERPRRAAAPVRAMVRPALRLAGQRHRHA